MDSSSSNNNNNDNNNDNNNTDESASSPSSGGAPSESGSVAQRWTCEACGCYTNSESDRSCSICGTSRDNNGSILRRAGLFERRRLAVRRNMLGSSGGGSNSNSNNDEQHISLGGMLMMDGYYHDFFESVIDPDAHRDVDDEQAVVDVPAEAPGIGSSSMINNRSAAAIRFGMAMRGAAADARPIGASARESSQRLSPEELLRAAIDNDSMYQPKWMNLSQIGGRMRTGNGIEVGDGGNQNVAYLPVGSGEGRALRALEAFPRSTPFASFGLPSASTSSSSFSSASASGQERRTRRVFGFRVAFAHPSKEDGENLGGRYLIGVTTTSFSSFSEKNALQQSPFFYGIEDAGNKYEGAGNPSSSISSREGYRARRRSSYAVAIKEHEAPRNEDGVLFGCREVVTCVLDFENRSLTFWRDEDGESKLIGTLVTNIPRSAQLYPIVVPYNAGSTVSITGMSGKPLPLLASFAATWKKAQLEKDVLRRKEIKEIRSVMIENGSFTRRLTIILLEIFSRYNGKASRGLNQIEASRLWYQCGMRLSSLMEICAKTDGTPNKKNISFQDFLRLLQRIIADDELHYRESSDFQIGEKVELASNYERFGDAINGPLVPGNRGTIIDLQGAQGSRQSIRVIYNSRRWWYQPQALVRERSGLTDSPGVWFLKSIIRSHGYDENKLELLVGKQVSSSSWKIGDFVAPKKLKGLVPCTGRYCEVDEHIGRIVQESSTSGSFPMRARLPGTVTVIFISKAFAESTSPQSGSSFKQRSNLLDSGKVSTSRLVHTSTFHGLSVSQQPRKAPSEAMDTDDDASDIVQSDFQGLKDLDPSAIEKTMKECGKTPTSLFALVEAGMFQSVLETLDCLMQNIQLLDNKESLPQAIAALGKLALCVAERSFPNECNASTESCDQRQQLSGSQYINQRNATSNESNAPVDVQRSSENEGLSIEASSERDTRSSSLLQRRRMLLSLMSRARRSNGDALGDIIGRELQAMPSMEMNADSAEALFFATRSDGNNFEDDNGHFENSRPTESASSMEVESLVRNQSDETLLDLILRGKNNYRPASEKRCAIPLLSIKSIVSMGILGNSLPWLRSFLACVAVKMSRKYSVDEFAVLKHASDDDGMPLLHLAIMLGCSGTIVEELIRYGAPVGETEVRLAAEVDLPEILSVILKHQVYSDGMIDLEGCSPAIKAVVSEARERQAVQNKKLREGAESFLVSFTKKFLQINLKRRQQQKQKSNDICGRALARVLVGSIELCALRKRDERILSPDSVENEGGNHVASKGHVSGLDQYGLLQVLPLSILGRSLAEEPSSLTNLLLLIEDYLCSKGINDGCVGLTLLSSLLERFPMINRSLEMERYGFAELVHSHDALSLNRSTEISSRLEKKSLTDHKSQDDSVVAPEIIFCPKKHAAMLHVTKHSSFRCDLCGVGVECGAIMYGCRECDWDACENCTDKVEGGIVKWKYVSELSTRCQDLIAQNTAVSDTDLKEDGIWSRGMMTNLKFMDNASEINTLSIRLLQRDPDSIQGLARLLKEKGRITMHQFLMVILPALHSTLMGKFPVGELNAGRRTKKPRVASMRSRENEIRIETNDEERLDFAKEILKLLVHDCAPQSESMDFQEDNDIDHDITEESREYMANEEDYDERNENKATQKKGRGVAKQLPEILRRLHQVLALHEEVKSLNEDKCSDRDGVSPGDLRSLKQPIKVRLTQQEVKGSKQQEKHHYKSNTTIFCEPLVSVDDLSRQILKTASKTDPEYVVFCRKLACESAIILERSLSSHGDVWRVAKIISYNEQTGYHGLRYVLGYRKSGGEDYLDLRKNENVSRLEYETDTTNLMLCARNFFVVNRNDVSEGKSAFVMDEFLAQGMVGQSVEFSEKNVLEVIGSLVESDVKSSSASYTVIGVETSEDEEKYDLVSEDGEVICGVPANRVNGIDPNKTDDSEMMSLGERSSRVNSDARRSLEVRGHLSRAFPFLMSGRQQVLEASSDSSKQKGKNMGKRLLQRSWSALALVESMRPADISATSQLNQESSMNPRAIKFTCSVGDSNIVIYADENLLEFPPSLQVRFSSFQTLNPATTSSPSETTLISLLQKQNQGETCDFFRDEGHQLFFSVVIEPSRTDRFVNKMVQKKQGVRNVCDHNPIELELKPHDDVIHQKIWAKADQSCKLSHITCLSDNGDGPKYEGFDEICVQCMEIIEFLARVDNKCFKKNKDGGGSAFVNQELSQKLIKQTEDPLFVVGGTVPKWCLAIPTMTPNIFSYDSRKLLLDRVAFGVSRSTLRQQDAKVKVGRLRQRMTTLRARAVELVGEAFSGGAEDPTALQLQADELYGMEETLATRVRTAFREKGWEEMSLQVAKAAIHRDSLLPEAMSIMEQYCSDPRLSRRRLEVRFDGESGFDAASGDEAGVTRGFYADIAEALMSCDAVAGVHFSTTCALGLGLKADLTSMPLKDASKPVRLPLWIPDMDSSGQVVIPTPRAATASTFGVFPRPLSKFHPQFTSVLKYFRFMGQLFAASMRDGFMFPLPLSSSFLKLVQHSGETPLPQFDPDSEFRGGDCDGKQEGYVLSSDDLPRPGFLGGEIYAVESYICRKLDRIDQQDEHLYEVGRGREYAAIATDKDFAREALGKSYDCSFNEYFQDRTFVDPLDPTQGITAHPLCENGCDRSITIHNIREWVNLAKHFMLHEGVLEQATAFKAGVDDFFPSDYLRLFTSEELQRDVCGMGDDVDNWDEEAIRKLFKLDGSKGAAEAFVAVAAIGGNAEALGRRFDPASTTIKYVVKALLEASPKQRRQFLSFVTSVPIVTPGLIEIVPIVSSSGKFLPMRDPVCLPRANTCARRLYLPKFESFESFSQVLWAVVKAESKHKGFFEWNL